VVKAERTLQEAAKVKDLSVDDALLKPKAKVVKVVKKKIQKS